ncbi:hypothetical protein [Chamaesiphon minutus]|uniref:Uncharacterized protein n=1 Tax=Chamaesiphon minutus (strain ATCC 27169 / PCC 6605) TaxID=1173020 RepID=K9UB34_CHAP6|nr:hypothetical protein [Chamaesiphon minutus]AFY91828.1 hypothetical protein Cha6605_0545 [Chamaesiphon minutus PCC 6605]
MPSQVVTVDYFDRLVGGASQNENRQPQLTINFSAIAAKAR